MREGTSNKYEEVSRNCDNKNKKIEKKLKGLGEKFNTLKQLIEQGQKATSGLLTATLGPIIARIREYAGKKIIWPGSLPATKDDINELKKHNNEICEQNKRLIKYLDKKDQFNTFLYSKVCITFLVIVFRDLH